MGGKLMSNISTHESAENYLETIFVLGQRAGVVRSIDIAGELNFTRPSVSVAMKKLRENGHIDVDNAGNITLTESGMEIARTMYSRHTLLTNFLVSLGVDEKVAVVDACRMEHVISPETFEKIREYFSAHEEAGKNP
jgi:Mn-dependent DtxR family transcriptional regulator